MKPMLRTMPRNLLTYALLTMLALTVGCASQTADKSGASTLESPQLAYVSRDLLFAMAQILPPRSTTIQLGKPRTEFGQELEDGFREIGFGMQRVGADQGPSYLSYSETTRVTSGQQKTHAFTVYVGEIGLEREYVFVKRGGVAPVGPLYVYGTTTDVTLNNQLFPAVADNQQIAQVEYIKSGSAATAVPEITLISDNLIKEIVTGSNRELPNYTSLNSQNMLIENLYTKGSSNFELVNEDYRIVRKDIITFGDDSLRLQNYGKDQIKKILTAFNSRTDKIRIIGCSNGPTAFEGGNEGLALGRSKRVVQELVNSGVDATSIQDEGCWAPTSLRDRFPSRGVVIEIRRKS